jgi:Leucine-rich repeat (LRR) protein
MFCRRLYENKLTGAIPTSLGNLMNLQELKLQMNALSGSIPSSLGNIKTLQFLYVILPKSTDDFLRSQKMHVSVV